MEISVLFFGVLAEVTKTGFKHYSGIGSFDDLIFRLRDEYPELIHYNYRIAINKQFADPSPELRSGDEVALLPPFAGG